uniref:Porin n=1 Tax=Prevotella sp. GTC17254 TaxID=3236794 RepID=A0AB33IVA2_9BACT
MRKAFITLCLLCLAGTALAQFDDNEFNQIDQSGNISRRNKNNQADSLGSHKEIPKGIKVWTVDSRFGDVQPAQMDTLSHMYMNTIFTTGLRGEYNTTGNLGAPRIHRVFIDRPEAGQFIFTAPYDFFVKPVDKFKFTNTLSPFTNLSCNTAGGKVNGEDHFTAQFGVNAGKKLGVGFNFDYLYGRGFYTSQSTSHFNYSMYGSYIADRYQAHLLLSTNHQKVAENGGIANDNYIRHPESYTDSYSTDEIPTILSKNWNRNDNHHIFLSQRYNLGFNRKVRMSEEEIKARKFAIESKKEQELRKAREKEGLPDEPQRRRNEDGKEPETFAGRPDDAQVVGDEPVAGAQDGGRIKVNSKQQADSLIAAADKAKEDTTWLKNEYVPVTSFIHTLQFDYARRIYQAYETPENFYANTYKALEKLEGDSIYDLTRHYQLKNTFAISLLEGFNKYAKAGLKGFLTSDIRHFTLPSADGVDTYNEQTISVGAQLNKTQGKMLHYNAVLETWLAGKDAGQLKLDATADLNIKLLGDTVQLAASGFFHRTNPTFYYRHYHARHFWWDNDDMSKILHTRLQGSLWLRKTRTHLRVAADNIKNHTYFAQSYTAGENTRTANTVAVKQHSGAVTLFTAELSQDFTFGPINWESVITYQKSSNNDVLPVPTLNAYTNLYLRFKIARVLKCDFGADARYFTAYYAPEYSPALGQYTVQTNTSTTGEDSRVKTGNYPIVNVYANFHLKHTRFFVMYSHVNAGSGTKNYFLTPHHPLNGRLLRFGLSWNFFN